jgi:hypothetical protein
MLLVVQVVQVEGRGRAVRLYRLQLVLPQAVVVVVVAAAAAVSAGAQQQRGSPLCA